MSNNSLDAYWHKFIQCRLFIQVRTTNEVILIKNCKDIVSLERLEDIVEYLF